MDTKEVVLVTINYRIGPFGFLSLGSDSCPGNQVKCISFIWDISDFSIGQNYRIRRAFDTSKLQEH